MEDEFPEFAGGVEMTWQVVARLGQLSRAPVQAALWQQVRRGALDFAGLASVVGALAGFFTIATTEVGFGLGVSVGVQILRVLVLGQLAGFVCALLLVAGPGTAATYELGLMRHSGELRTLRLIGIDPRDYLMLPRVLGFALSLFLLSVVFQASAVFGGAALAAVATSLTFSQQIEALATTLDPVALMVSVLDSLVVGSVVGSLVCRYGLRPEFTPEEMPRIAQRLLGGALVAFVLVHGGAALLLS